MQMKKNNLFLKKNNTLTEHRSNDTQDLPLYMDEGG